MVYVAPAYQSEVTAALTAQAPDMVVFDSHFWSARIDEKGLQQRTPKLAEWVEKRYPYNLRLNGSELRASEAHSGFSASR